MGLFDGLLRCGNDGMPMLQIGDAYRCVAEYLDHYIGGPEVTIVDLITHPVTLIFSNGYSLPLLCACCGQPLHIPASDSDEALDISAGLTLLNIDWSADAPNELNLDFGREDEETGDIYFQYLTVHLDTVRLLQGPGLPRVDSQRS